MQNVNENKNLATHFLKLVEAGNVDELCSLVAPGWKMYGGPPNLPAGPEGIRTLFGTFGKIEQQWIIEDVIAEGDKVVVRATNICFQESFFGIPANGKTQQFTAIFIFVIRDGQIVNTWRNADDLGRVLQLGAKLQAS